MEYQEFLQGKIKKNIDSGFEISESELNKSLFDFQKVIVKRAIKAGKYAIFADTGLGKTIMQCSFADAVSKHENKPVLIVAPLAVSGQTIKDVKKFGIIIDRPGSAANIHITNYEQIENIDVSKYCGVVLDESSILKNYTGKTRNRLIDTFSKTPYKLCCTATPSPNDLMELGNHSEFLNYMSYDEMLAMYFTHDGGETAKWKLKNHGKKEFFSWIGSWATVISKPSDLGFSDEGYNLPGLKYIEYKIKSPKKDNGLLFNDSHVNATDFNKELRLTINERMEKVKSIIEQYPKENFLIWINQNEEGDKLKEILEGYDFREVRGSDNSDKKENDLIEFGENKYRILVTKGKIAGMGMNYQNCSHQIFTALDFSFEKLYQSIRRSYRFGQKKNVNVHLITVDTMQNVISSIEKKQKTFLMMRREMQEIINKYKDGVKLMEFDTEDFKTEKYHIMRGDSVQRIKEIESDSIGYSIFSPPFSSLYVYSDHMEDMGNSRNNDEFYMHFRFLVKELLRITMPGRNVSFHVANIPASKSKDGYIGLKDFRGEMIKIFIDEGFIFHSEVCIWKDPVISMQRTKALGLLHKQVKKDSAMSRQGIPDYLVTMRKPGENKKPIAGEFDHFAGDKSTFTDTGNISIDIWQRYASPVWMDIDPSNTLQYMAGRDEKDERHICPLQLDVIHRGLQLWSLPGDKVFTPFAGIGSEVYESAKTGRYGIGIELKESYFEQMKKNLSVLDKELSQMNIFNN